MKRPWLNWLAFDYEPPVSLEELAARERAVWARREAASDRCWEAALPLVREEQSRQ